MERVVGERGAPCCVCGEPATQKDFIGGTDKMLCNKTHCLLAHLYTASPDDYKGLCDAFRDPWWMKVLSHIFPW